MPNEPSELRPVSVPESKPPLFLYTRKADQAVLIVSNEVIKMLRSGNILMTPDGAFILAYSYDMEETANQATMMMQCSGTIDPEIMQFILKEGARRKKKVKDAMANTAAKKKATKRRRPKS